MGEHQRNWVFSVFDPFYHCGKVPFLSNPPVYANATYTQLDHIRRWMMEPRYKIYITFNALRSDSKAGLDMSFALRGFPWYAVPNKMDKKQQ